jgi:hypothetical protein
VVPARRLRDRLEPLPWPQLDGTLIAQGYLIFELMAGNRFGKLDLDLAINNLINTDWPDWPDWREAQFADASAVMPGGRPVEQMHFTPRIPLTAPATAAYRF